MAAAWRKHILTDKFYSWCNEFQWFGVFEWLRHQQPMNEWIVKILPFVFPYMGKPTHGRVVHIVYNVLVNKPSHLDKSSYGAQVLVNFQRTLSHRIKVSTIKYK